MTLRRTTTIEPHDIVALEFECGKCSARYSVPIREIKLAPMFCPNCRVQWLRGVQTSQSPDPQDIAIQRFVAGLQEIKGEGLNAKIRLEIFLPPLREGEEGDKIKA